MKEYIKEILKKYVVKSLLSEAVDEVNKLFQRGEVQLPKKKMKPSKAYVAKPDGRKITVHSE